MKKEITIKLTVEIDDSKKDFADRIKHDLEQEIACCSYCYEVENITIK